MLLVVDDLGRSDLGYTGSMIASMPSFLAVRGRDAVWAQRAVHVLPHALARGEVDRAGEAAVAHQREQTRRSMQKPSHEQQKASDTEAADASQRLARALVVI